LNQRPDTEDWFNRVVPALMLLRAYARFASTEQRGMVRFTIDAQSSTGFSQETEVGTPPLPADEIDYPRPSPGGRDFGQQQLVDWLDGIDWPYAPEPQDDAAGP
jgi:hypothetical protein